MHFTAPSGLSLAVFFAVFFAVVAVVAMPRRMSAAPQGFTQSFFFAGQ
jgi:hypothetical protein